MSVGARFKRKFGLDPGVVARRGDGAIHDALVNRANNAIRDLARALQDLKATEKKLGDALHGGWCLKTRLTAAEGLLHDAMRCLDGFVDTPGEDSTLRATAAELCRQYENRRQS